MRRLLELKPSVLNMPSREAVLVVLVRARLRSAVPRLVALSALQAASIQLVVQALLLALAIRPLLLASRWVGQELQSLQTAECLHEGCGLLRSADESHPSTVTLDNFGI